MALLTQRSRWWAMICLLGSLLYPGMGPLSAQPPPAAGGEENSYSLLPPAAGNTGGAAALRRSRALRANALAVGGILTWGVLKWDYFSQSPQERSEGWFGHQTDEGGADKAGHLWFSYALSHAFAAYYRHIGYAEGEAALYGPLSATAVTGLMEFGDSFSAEHGFSWEDMVANLAGAACGWWLLENPQWQQRLALRWEYRPDFSDLAGDISTDYQHSRYLIVLKAEGFKEISSPWLKYLELQVGYYARGYDSWNPAGPDLRRRRLYLGLGLNVGRLIRPWWQTRLFDYLQLPYSGVAIRNGLE